MGWPTSGSSTGPGDPGTRSTWPAIASNLMKDRWRFEAKSTPQTARILAAEPTGAAIAEITYPLFTHFQAGESEPTIQNSHWLYWVRPRHQIGHASNRTLFLSRSYRLTSSGFDRRLSCGWPVAAKPRSGVLARYPEVPSPPG